MNLSVQNMFSEQLVMNIYFIIIIIIIFILNTEQM